MMQLFEGLLSAGSGGLFGGLMAIGTSFMKARAMKADHIRTMEVAQFELDAEARRHELGLESTRAKMSSDGLLASIQADQVQNVPSWAAGIKALFRPFLTTGLVVIAAYIFTLLLDAAYGESNAMSKILDINEINGMLTYTVYSLIFSACTAVAWWFGERGLAPPRSK